MPGSGCACTAGHHPSRMGGAGQTAGASPRPIGRTGACAGSLNRLSAAAKAGGKRRWLRWRCRPQERGGRASAGRSAGPPSCARPAATMSGAVIATTTPASARTRPERRLQPGPCKVHVGPPPPLPRCATYLYMENAGSASRRRAGPEPSRSPSSPLQAGALQGRAGTCKDPAMPRVAALQAGIGCYQWPRGGKSQQP